MADLNMILSNIRDLVDEYEKLITRLKYIKESSRIDPDKVDTLIPRLNRIYNKTVNNLREFKNTDLNINNDYIKYLKTYYNYLIMISIPYTIDLLEEIYKILANSSSFNNRSKDIIMYIEKFRGIINS
ncbi:MAG: hypothetical protein B6U89_07735 [Desulfurococcales archaeon ex4484_58]|nr:MAG: hypothetical protein B6U89_07735 [Desulfurococcales archaeon ex4484_58]